MITPVEARPVARAPFGNKVFAWALIAAALPVAAVSSLLGMAPNFAEDDRGNVIRCGPTLFYTGQRPSKWCNAVFDPWRLIAEVGLFIAACLFFAAITFGVRSAVAQRSRRSI